MHEQPIAHKLPHTPSNASRASGTSEDLRPHHFSRLSSQGSSAGQIALRRLIHDNAMTQDPVEIVVRDGRSPSKALAVHSSSQDRSESVSVMRINFNPTRDSTMSQDLKVISDDVGVPDPTTTMSQMEDRRVSQSNNSFDEDELLNEVEHHMKRRALLMLTIIPAIFCGLVIFLVVCLWRLSKIEADVSHTVVELIIIAAILFVLVPLHFGLTLLFLRDTRKYCRVARGRRGKQLKLLQKMAYRSNVNRNKAKEANKAKSDFLSFLCHELRNPLHAIVMTCHEAGRSKISKTPEVVAFFTTIKDSAEMMVAIVNDALDMNKIEAGRLKLETIPFDFVDIVNKLYSSHRPLVRHKKLEFFLEISNDIPSMFFGDPTRIRQVIGNLLSNALKFTSAGSITLKAWAEKAQMPQDTSMLDPDSSIMMHDDQDQVLWYTTWISVTDTGKGISEDFQKTLFEPFSQAKLDVYRKHGGTGLGLSICKQLAEAFNGDITVSSVPEKGASFTAHFCLPRLSVEDQAVVRGEERERRHSLKDVEKLSESLFKGTHVLVVEDNAINRKLTKRVLEGYNFNVDVAEDGQIAVDKVTSADKYDLILMDLNMPNMDGYEASHVIRIDRKFDVPIIALTGNALEQEKDRCEKEGIQHFCTKPLHPEKMLRLFALILSERKRSLSSLSN
eukprot:469796_1